MVILGRSLFLAVLAGDHPLRQFAEPTAQVLGEARRKGRRTFQGLHRGGDFDQVEGVDDANATSRRNARNRLRKVKVRAHTQLRIQEEYAEELGGLARVFFVPSDFIGGGQGRARVTQGLHGEPMLTEVLGVGLPVAADIR